LGDAIFNRILKISAQNSLRINWGDAIFNRILIEIENRGVLDQRLKIAAK